MFLRIIPVSLVLSCVFSKLFYGVEYSRPKRDRENERERETGYGMMVADLRLFLFDSMKRTGGESEAVSAQ